MTSWDKQIAVYLLLGSILASPALAAQQPNTPESLPEITETLPPYSYEPVDSEAPCEAESPSGTYYSTRWRNWLESGADGEFCGHRPAPYVDICTDCPDEHAWFFEGGMLALQRDRWEGDTLVTKDGTTLVNKEDLLSHLEWGGRFSAGTRCWNCTELEFTGFSLARLNYASTSQGPFNVNLPVFNPPPGFDDFGSNVSLVAVEYSTDLAGFEVLCRKWGLIGCDDPCCGTSCSDHRCPISGGLEFGIRYLNIDEEFSIYSQFSTLQAPNGFQDYNYVIDADNHIIGPEIGLQLRTCPWLCFDVLFSSRLAIAANVIDTRVKLSERTGNVAFNETREEVSCTQVWDNSIYLRMHLGHSIDVRVGYQLLWVNGYAGASDQFSRNLSRPGHFDDENGVLFSGPSMLIQINF